MIPSSQNTGVKFVSEYMTEALICEGSEFCFEEVRAEKYFKKLREKREQLQKQLQKNPNESGKTIYPFMNDAPSMIFGSCFESFKLYNDV